MNELSLLDTFFGSPRFNFGQNTCLPSVDVIESKDSWIFPAAAKMTLTSALKTES